MLSMLILNIFTKIKKHLSDYYLSDIWKQAGLSVFGHVSSLQMQPEPELPLPRLITVYRFESSSHFLLFLLLHPKCFYIKLADSRRFPLC